MADKKPASQVVVPAAPAKDVLEVIATDEHAGKGGSFVFDPLTGKRTPSTTQKD
jgi:hypothetical protein